MNTNALPGSGLPQDRLARLAARRAFVDLKQDFMMATAGLPGLRGEWLRERVRRAEDPYNLWQLRHSLFAALGGNDPETCSIRHALKTGLDTLFSDYDSSFGATTTRSGHTTQAAPLSQMGSLPRAMPAMQAAQAQMAHAGSRQAAAHAAQRAPMPA